MPHLSINRELNIHIGETIAESASLCASLEDLFNKEDVIVKMQTALNCIFGKDGYPLPQCQAMGQMPNEMLLWELQHDFCEGDQNANPLNISKGIFRLWSYVQLYPQAFSAAACAGVNQVTKRTVDCIESVSESSVLKTGIQKFWNETSNAQGASR